MTVNFFPVQSKPLNELEIMLVFLKFRNIFQLFFIPLSNSLGNGQTKLIIINIILWTIDVFF